MTKPAVLLWHALMHLNNKAGWQESFTVARSVIEAKTGLKKDAYYKARNQLQQKGLISFKERGTKATVFQIHSFLSVYQTRTQTTNETRSETRTQTTPQTVTKRNETKLNDEVEGRAEENPFVIYQDNFGVLKPLIQDSINDWCDFFSDEVVIAAMKLGIKNNAHSFNYVESILRDWFQNNLKTIDDVRTYERSKKKTVPFPNQNQKESRSFDDIVKSWEQKKEAGHYD